MINVVVFLLLVLVTIRCYVFGIGAIPIFAITVTKPRHDKLWVVGKFLFKTGCNLISRSAHWCTSLLIVTDRTIFVSIHFLGFSGISDNLGFPPNTWSRECVLIQIKTNTCIRSSASFTNISGQAPPAMDHSGWVWLHEKLPKPEAIRNSLLEWKIWCACALAASCYVTTAAATQRRTTSR